MLVAAALVAAAWGLFEALRLRHVRLPLYVGASLAGCAILASFGSPWVDAKVLATASPAIPLAALAGRVAGVRPRVARSRRPAPSCSSPAACSGRTRSPTTMPGSLRATSSPSWRRSASASPGRGRRCSTSRRCTGRRTSCGGSIRTRPASPATGCCSCATGASCPPNGYADIDGFILPAVLVYRTLVVPRSPVESRPPSVYTLVWQGRYYDVWERQDSYPRILEHISLGKTRRGGGGGAVPGDRAAGEAGGGLEREPGVRGPPAAGLGRPRPARRARDGWGPVGDEPRAAVGRHVARSGRDRSRHVRRLAGGVVRGPDGRARRRPAGRCEPPPPRAPGPVRPLRHGASSHPAGTRSPSATPAPTSTRGARRASGSSPGSCSRRRRRICRSQTLDPSRARELCGRSLDWIEAVAPA